MISIAIPVYNMKNKDFFLERCLQSIRKQTYQDYEIVITEAGAMAKNYNQAIKESNGEIIKILSMDDYLTNEHSLQEIVDNFKGGWLVTGCLHDMGAIIGNPHYPSYNPDVYKGNNTIGGPSVLTIENKDPLLMDENLSWLIDCDYYRRLYERYGEPAILNSLNVTIGVGDHQATNILSNEVKDNEYHYMIKKHE